MLSSRMKFIMAVLGYALACRILPWVLHQVNAAGFPIDPANTWYPWNFSPVAAACVLCGAIVPRKGWGLGLPLLLMLVGDVLIDLITGFQFATVRNYFVQLWVYAGILMTTSLGMWVRPQPGWRRGVPAAFAGEVLFFVLTNFATWLSGFIPASTVPLYELSSSGLWTCYAEALPFFGRSLISTAVYALLFFSPWGLGLAGVRLATPSMSPEPVYEAARG